MAKEAMVCPSEIMDSEDMLFMLYTSGSTGKPKGIVHTQAGYLLYAAITHKVSVESLILFFYFSTVNSVQITWIMKFGRVGHFEYDVRLKNDFSTSMKFIITMQQSRFEEKRVMQNIQRCSQSICGQFFKKLHIWKRYIFFNHMLLVTFPPLNLDCCRALKMIHKQI